MTPRLLRLAWALGLGTLPAAAQTTQGLIAGDVRHARTGAPIAQATVAYVHQSTGNSGSAATDAAGGYFLPLLSPGVYRLRVTAPQFQAQEVQELELPVAGRLEVSFALRPLNDVWESGQYRSVFLPGSRTIVTFFGPDVDSSRSGTFEAVRGQRGALESTLSEVINPQLVRDLPLAGRDVYTMLATQPGVTADAGTARGLGLSAMGQRPSAANFLLDGLENNNYLVSGPLTAVAPEAIQEYRVSTNNFSAEYGRTAGFVANAVSKAGGNQFHGLGYFYLKNEALNANGFQENRAGLSRPPAKERQMGFQAGGPILRGRLFFSAAFEHLRSRGRQQEVTLRLPTPDYTRFVFAGSPGSRLFQQFGTPAPSNGDFRIDLPFAPPVSIGRPLSILRVDYTPRSGRDRLMGRYSLGRVSRPDFIWSPYPDFVSGLNQDIDSGAVNYTRTLRPGLWNELKAGYSRDNLGWERARPEIPTLDVIDGNSRVIMPGSLAAYGYRNRSRTWELLDSLTWVRGRHLATFGGGLLWRSIDGYLSIGRDGYYQFGSSISNGLIDFALGTPRQFLAAVDLNPNPLRTPDFSREYRYRQYSFFAQDTYRLSRRLTLNFGLRYENFGAPRNTGAVKDAILIPGSGVTSEQRLLSGRFDLPSGGSQRLYAGDANDWAGRFGFSYDVTGRGRTLVRGAYGVFYDRPFDNLWQNVRANRVRVPAFIPSGAVDFLEPVSQALGRYQRQAELAVSGAQFPSATYFRPEIRTAYAQTYFYGVQHLVAEAWSVEINGAGSLGRKLLVTDTWNRSLAAPYGYVAYRDSQGLSNYQGLTAIARYRGRRAQFQAAYTFSHAIDHQSEPLQGDFFNLSFTGLSGGGGRALRAAFLREGDLRRERGSSDFDQRHNLVFFSVWELPAAPGSRWNVVLRDWRVAQLAAFRSGFPFSLSAPSRPDPVTGELFFNNRPDVVNPGAVWLDPARDAPGGRLLLNRAAFGEPAGAGNLGRNALRGPGLYNIDLSLARSFPLRWIGEAGRLTVRADAFNVFNHANLNAPDQDLTSGTFGVALFGRQGRDAGFPALTPFRETGRQIQLILRLEF